MLVEFKKILIQDTFAYEYLEFDFTTGIHSIGGLNGASKTSIYLAVVQCLFNKNPKGTKIDDVSNTVTGKPYEITLFFDKGKDRYKIINSRKQGTIYIEYNGKNISKKTIPQNLELIKDILSDQYETFANMTYQSTDSTLDLLEESTDTARKNFINKILKFDELDEMLVDVKNKAKEVKSEVASTERLLTTLESSVLPLRTVEDYISTELLEIKLSASLGAISSSTRIAEELSAKLTKIDAQKAAREVYQEGIEKAKKIEAKLRYFKSSFGSKEEVENNLAEQNTWLAESEYKHFEAEKEINLSTEPELVCKRCGQANNAEAALEQYAARMEELNNVTLEQSIIIDDLKGNIKYLKEELAKWVEKERLESELASFKNTKVTFDEFSQKLYDDLAGQLKQYSLRLKEETKLCEQYRSKLADIKEHNTKVKLTTKFNEEAEENNKAIQAKIEKARQELFILQHKQDLLSNWQRILGAQGYRVNKMNKFLGLLNSTMERYSSIISDGKIQCAFYVTEEGKIDFTVVDPDKKVAFANWSAGEKARLRLMCLFSILEIQETLGSASYNLLVLDEIFASLDEDGREGLFKVLAHLKGHGKCIYTISHTPIANSVVFDSFIKVEKENGISRLV